MRITILLTALLMLCGGLAVAQPDIPMVTPPLAMLTSEQIDDYRLKAALLAQLWLHDTHSPDTAAIVIPEGLVSSLNAALIRIGKESRSGDSAINCYFVIDYGPTPFRSESFVVDLKKAPWASAWRKGKKLTGVAAIDSLVVKYDLTPEVEKSTRKQLTVVFYTERALNVWALGEHIAAIPGIDRDRMIPMAVPDIGDATLGTKDGAWLIDIRAGAVNSFDLPHLLNYTWSFQVFPNGEVRLVSSGYAEPKESDTELEDE